VVARFRHIYLIQHSRVFCANCLSPGRHPCTTGCRITAVECLLRPFTSWRCLLSVDDTRHHPYCWRCHLDSLLWHRPRTNALSRRPFSTLQAPHIHCIFLSPWICDFCLSFYRAFLIRYFAYLFSCKTSQTHITEYSLSRRIAKSIADCNSSPRNISSSSIHVDLPTHAANLTTSLDEINDSTERTPLLDPKSGTISPPPKARQPIDPDLKSFDRTRLLLAISYASFSGIISGMCLLFAKSGVELLLFTLGGKNQFWRWEAWVLVLGLIIFALLQLWYLHKALVLADPTLVCPCK